MAAELYNKYAVDSFYAVDARGEIVLIPKPRDPVKALERLLAREKRSPREVRREIAEYMEQEASRRHALRRH